MSNAVESTPHVAVMAFPYGTHAAPLISIIRHLAYLSPDTHFSFLSTEASNATIFSSSVKTPPNLTRRDVPEPPADGRPHPVVMGEFMSTAAEMFRREVAEAERAVERKATCLVTDAFYGFAADMAAEMCVGWVAFWTAGPASLSAHFHTDLIRDKVRTPGIVVAGGETDALKFIPGMSRIRIQDIPQEVLGDLSSPFPKALHEMARALPRAMSVFINSFEALHPTITSDLKSKLRNFLSVGPLSLLINQPSSLDTHDCLPWLDTQSPNSVAYISFGTVTAPPPAELFAIAEALEESKTPYLWSLKDHSRGHLPDGFLNRTSGVGKVVPWAPQVDILDHSSVGVFITHCGWNSVLEGVISGLPMIGRPFFGDQMINARVISAVLEIGCVIEGGSFTKTGLIDSLELVLTGKDGRKMRDKAGELKKTAIEAVKEDGSSVESLKLLSSLINEVHYLSK